ncbi:MAG TPA: 3-phosphoshikimate 1-carboxyvinyltransferase, partial [Nitrospiria bacterium]|nr:3-phosphoshikimate 1-carboxyvinyltransferase [Nitrospiria bacterium]
YLPADDCLRTVAAMRALGRVIDTVESDDRPALRIAAGTGALREAEDVIDCGNSGTSIRLLTGLVAGLPMCTVLTGDASLRRRPMARVVEPLREMGAMIVGRDDGRLAPLAVAGRRLKAGEFRLPVASAQVKSAILLAGLGAEGRTAVSEPSASRDHTERMLREFGVPVATDGGAVSVTGPVNLTGTTVDVPGDISSAAFLIAAALLVPGSELEIGRVGVNPTRTGFLDILASMGAAVKLGNAREVSGEPTASLTVRTAPLRGATIKGQLVPRAIDEFPILCVLAAFANGETIVDDAGELRVKESDRIRVMAEELGKLGITVEERPAGMRIVGPQRATGGRCSSHGDHRVAMALAVAALRATGPTTIDDVECVGTSFPGFFELLDRVRR